MRIWPSQISITPAYCKTISGSFLSILCNSDEIKKEVLRRTKVRSRGGVTRQQKP
jgi:hypothetical protein